jgi:hypothetical protein
VEAARSAKVNVVQYRQQGVFISLDCCEPASCGKRECRGDDRDPPRAAILATGA